MRAWLGELLICFFVLLIDLLPDASKFLPRVLFSVLWIKACVCKTSVVVKERLVTCAVLFVGNKSSSRINPEPSVLAGVDGAPLG